MNPICKQIRRDILAIAHASGHGHIPTCFSVVEIVYAVYATMKHDPRDPRWDERDIFVLSKGHASLAHYCVLSHFGYFPLDDVRTFGGFESRFGCHADRLKVPGIEASTGSLGHGIGLSVGMALGIKLKKQDRRVFTVIGDGESNEGSVWEAVMVGVNLKLDNLVIIYDNNYSHARGLQIQEPAKRFSSFGCDARECNGHSINELKQQLRQRSDRPVVIVANTKKGCGCSTLIKNHYAWHRRSPTPDELSKLCGELDEETI
ncbi:MAG: transketolase [Chitinivibrionales bacterium]